MAPAASPGNDQHLATDEHRWTRIRKPVGVHPSPSVVIFGGNSARYIKRPIHKGTGDNL